MTYVLLPNSGQTLGQTRSAIRTNFELIQTVFEQNHVDLDQSPDGKHKFLQMPEQSSAPNTDPNEGGLYCKEVTGIGTQLFFKGENNGTEYQLTSVGGGVGLVAYCNADGRSTNGVCTLRKSQNITSVTRTGQGSYTVLFTTNAPSIYYVVNGLTLASSTGSGLIFVPDPDATYANSFRVNGFDFAVYNIAGSVRDPVNFQFSVWGG